MNSDINTAKLLYPIDTIQIGERSFISIGLYEKRGNSFYDVVLNIKNKEVFLGRFEKTSDKICVKYYNGKILVCYANDNNDIINEQITKVLTLYEIIDDTFYSCTDEEALKLFDETINTSHLINKNKPIHRSDIEKRKRLQ